MSSMDWEADVTGVSQREAYDQVFNALRHALAQALAEGSKPLLATYLHTLLAYPDGRTRGETIFDPGDGRPHNASPAAVGGEALPQGESPSRPGGGGEARREEGAGLRHPHGDAGHHRADGGRADPPRDAGHGARLNLRIKVLYFVHADWALRSGTG